MALTDIKCKSEKPKDKPFKMFDGGGLYLEVMPSGKKLWRLKYYYLKKEKRISFGAYPMVSLAEAREERLKAKKLLHEGVDPSQHRKDNKLVLVKNAQNTFKAIALEWHENEYDRWSKGYADKLARAMEKHLFPYIGNRPIADIKAPELWDVLRTIEKKSSLETAHKAKQIAGMVFRHGIKRGLCEWNAAENLKGALKPRNTEHFRTLALKQLPAFLRALERNEARLYERTRRAVWFSLYTFCRPKEIRTARWEHINFDEARWTIPAKLMKMKRDHVVPLSTQAIQVLKEQREEVEMLNTPWVFPSQHKWRNPMSDGTVNKAIKRLGFGKDMVAHGFRALARTAIAEQLKYNPEIIEKQLAHKTNNALGEAYDRTQFIDERVVMMQDWANWVREQKNEQK